MSLRIPARPSLRQLQIQAKGLANQLGQANPEALARLRTHHPEFFNLKEGEIPRETLKLHHAQLVIASEYGFDCWPKLRAEVERISLHRLFESVEQGDVKQARTLLRQYPNLVSLDRAETDEHRALHYAVLRRDEPMVRLLMKRGADAHKGIYPFRDATTAYVLARDREFADIVNAIEEEEQFRLEEMSCPNATVAPEQDQLYHHIGHAEYALALEMLDSAPGLAKACDRDGGTALHKACERGALPVIDWLLEHRANPRKKNSTGWTPLESAVVNVGWKERERCASFPEVAPRLLRHGALMSPVVAAALGDLEALRALDLRDPKAVREVHLLGQGGLLSIAVKFGRPDALRLLLDLGLDVNERHSLPNLEEEVFSQGQPLWLAAAFGEYEMARMLLDRGADPSAKVYASGTPVDRAYGARDEMMIKLLADSGGHPEPYLIGSSGDEDAARQFLNGLPSDKAIDDLLWGAAGGGGAPIVEMCLSRLDWTPTDTRWYRILVGPLSLSNHAPHSEHPECFDRSTYPQCLRLLVRHGIDVNMTGRKGETLLHRIMAAGKIWGREVMTAAERIEFLRIALEASPDLTVRDNLLKSTPLGWACRWGREAEVRLLLEHGADAEEPEAEPWATPTAWAIKMGYPKIVEMLRRT